ncbi:glycosyltransferase family 4 protein [Spirosoma jeollabukense]
MRIFFDHQAFSLQTFGGISRYYAELINGINKTIDNKAYLPILFSNNTHLRENNFKVNSFFAKSDFRGKSKFIQEANQLFSIANLQQKPYDVFHATYYNPYFIPYLKRHPFVITFLDMINEKFADQFPDTKANNLIYKRKKLLANRADKIIAISESTKQDIIELLNINPEKIEVIYLGSSLIPVIYEKSEKWIKDPYLLFVGRRERYKNFKGLLESIHPLLKEYKLKLICAGGGPFVDDERLLIHSFGAHKWVQQIPIADDYMLRKLYQEAFAFIFPSLYEGFGIPVLEAFSCNCPCIISNKSSLPEVAGNAALYIDPTMPNSIVDAVKQLLHDSTLRQILIERGSNQLSKFSWKQNITETLSLYKTLT